NRNTATTTLWNGRFAKSILIRLACRLVANTVYRRYITLSAMMRFYVYFYAFWCNTNKMFCEQFGDFYPILIRHQTHRYFSKGFTTNHGFGTFAGVTAPNTINI